MGTSSEADPNVSSTSFLPSFLSSLELTFSRLRRKIFLEPKLTCSSLFLLSAPSLLPPPPPTTLSQISSDPLQRDPVLLDSPFLLDQHPLQPIPLLHPISTPRFPPDRTRQHRPNSSRRLRFRTRSSCFGRQAPLDGTPSRARRDDDQSCGQGQGERVQDLRGLSWVGRGGGARSCEA